MLGKMLHMGRSYFFKVVSFVEVAFFILNFLSTYLIESYNFYLVTNYLKIINVTRISNIFMFIKRRQKQALVDKYRKERERI